MEVLTPDIRLDQPSILPDWKDGKYHDYYDTVQILNDFNNKFPDLVNVFSVGKSVIGKNIWCIRITNEENEYAPVPLVVSASVCFMLPSNLE